MNYKQNILDVYAECNTNGKDWYEKANIFAKNLSEANNIPLFKVVGIISALSPMKTWRQNKLLAEEFIRTGKAGHVGVFVQKCIDILKCDSKEDVPSILKGMKTTSFYWNILMPTQNNNVTIDRHAANIAVYGTQYKRTKGWALTKKRYLEIENAFINAAQETSLTPIQLQAVTWVHIRDKYSTQ